jgi:predicted RNA-binding protein with PUA domain
MYIVGEITMTITIFQLAETDWQCEYRPNAMDIVIWKGNEVKYIIQAETAFERNKLAHQWLTENVPEYNEKYMKRIL